VFYLAIAIAFVLLAAGVLFAPGLWKLAWVAGWLACLMVLPAVLGALFDPLNVARIRRYCRRAGVSEVRVDVFPNHYGVHFQKNQKSHYAKCQVKGWQLKWKGLSPAEIQ
jgi:hypothetical protein